MNTIARSLTATILALVACGGGNKSITSGGGGGVPPDMLDDFSTYTSISNYLSDPKGIYSTGEDVGTSQMFLDNSTGYGGSTQSVRFDFPDRTADTASRCADYTIGRNIKLPTAKSELWVEIAAKYSANWTTKAPAAWSCLSNADYKFAAARVDGTGRYMLFAGTYGTGWQFGYPGNDEGANSSVSGYYGNAAYPFTTTGNPWDGQWHVYRFHYKVGNPGAAEWWYDGVKMPSFTNVDASGATDIYGVAIGRNLNQGPGQAQSIWWGRIAIWGSNPGW